MFTVEQRERVREALVELGRRDTRVVAAAAVGSSARGGDRWSDLDLTFGLAEGAPIDGVLADWTAELSARFDAVHLFDLPFLSSLYRVFLLPGGLQVDVSFTPGAEFGALGPDFALLFGEAVERRRPEPATARHLFGMAVHHLARARVCVERGRVWQAEHWIADARQQALAAACAARGLPASEGRGLDRLPEEVLGAFAATLPASVEPDELRRALERVIDAALAVARDVPGLPAGIEERLRELSRDAGVVPAPAPPPRPSPSGGEGEGEDASV